MPTDSIDLESIYNSLHPPTGDESTRRFNAAVVPGFERYRVARDCFGNPALLISTDTAATGTHPPPLRLERLDVQHNAICQIQQASSSPIEERLTVIRCTADDLASYFLRIAELMMLSVGPHPGRPEVMETISHLVRLFQALGRPSRGSVQGLWAELFLIAGAHNPQRLLHGWRAEPTEKFDFSLGRQRLEVKSVSGYERKHYFSLDQIRTSEPLEVVVASVFVERAGGGWSIRDLLNRVQQRIGDVGEESLRMEEIVAATLGSGFQRGIEERFDFEHAAHTLRFYAADQIPSVDPAVPPEITAVRFSSDLSEVVPLHEFSRFDPDGLFSGLLPRVCF
jgi:hypothetical protein